MFDNGISDFFTIEGKFDVGEENQYFDIFLIENENLAYIIRELNFLRQEYNKMIDERIKQLQNQ